MRKFSKWFAIGAVSLGLTAACIGDGPTTPPTAAQQAQAKADANNASNVYIPKNNVELNNYNNRQRIADDPSTILWCTSAFPIPSSPLFTIPILGKLTSSTKRPTPSTTTNTTADTSYSPELPGPDGMYGTSVPYQYGFTPGGVYVEFSASMNTYCTTEPTIWQRQSTTIAISPDPKLLAAQQACSALVTNKTADAAAQCQALLLAATK